MIPKQFAWIGGVTAAVVTGLYVLFGPTVQKKSRKKGRYNQFGFSK